MPPSTPDTTPHRKPQITLKLRARLKNLPVPARFARLYISIHARVKAHMALPCALCVGLLPPLCCAALLAIWQLLPAGICAALPADARPLTALSLCAAPFAAGFAFCRQRPGKRPASAALPAFWLWLAGVLLCNRLFAVPSGSQLAASAVTALLLSIAGGMCALKQSVKKPEKSA